jgi:hypothetical protein
MSGASHGAVRSKRRSRAPIAEEFSLDAPVFHRSMPRLEM